ncbi:MAG: hypothetical protein KC618_04910 [Candidatus Omnitrophica bacterium]|nr:hypothetical protein [Candidatus Omnitrophota bacterium]
MVVSCLRKSLAVVSLLLFLYSPSALFAESRILTDAELDAISAGNLPDILAKLSEEKQTTNIGNDVLSFLTPFLDQGVAGATSGLVQVHASDSSNVIVQTNIVVLTNIQGADINLSNTITIN